jgi:hypothetical protein
MLKENSFNLIGQKSIIVFILYKQLFYWRNKLANSLALFAIVFASLAPTLSHAFAPPKPLSFAQAVCANPNSAQGKSLLIQVKTTLGKQLTLKIALPQSQDSAPHASLHFDHCPFCHAGVADVVIPQQSPAFTLFLQQQALHLGAQYSAPIVVTQTYVLPLSQAPPLL